MSREPSHQSNPPSTALIIGATGSFGAHAALALIRRGWRIRALARDPAAAAVKLAASIDWIAGDAMNAADVASAARGCDLVIHAANPPGYRNWRGLALPMLRNAIAAAKAEDARIVLPGNVYNFAPDSGSRIGEDAPQRPATRKGAIRVEMEAMLREASAEGPRVLILRAGDYFGPAAPNSVLSWLTTRRKGRLSGVYVMGPAEVGHAFAYLPDVAETLARLLQREADLGAFEVFNFRGHWLERGDEMALEIRRASGRPDLPIKAFPHWLIWALAPFVETFRELLEMRYLTQRPVGLDNAKLIAFLGEEPHTPLDQAVRAALGDLERPEGVSHGGAPPAMKASLA